MSTSSFKGPDAGLRKLMRDHLKPFGHWWQAVETGGTTAGIPDSHCLGPGGTYWVESKRTLSRTGRVKFEPHQVQWHRKHAPWIPTFLAVRLLEGAAGGGHDDGLAIFRGDQVDALLAGGTGSGQSILWVVGGPRSWSWSEISDIFPRNPD